MAIRDKMAAKAQPHLEPGETIQAVFGAQTSNGWWALLTIWLLVLRNQYRVVVVTDRRIVVGRSGHFTTTPFNEILHSLPRQTRIGPPQGLWWKCETLGSRLYVHKRFHRDVNQADSLITV